MPDLGEHSHYRDVDTQLLQQSNLYSWDSRCLCSAGVESDLFYQCYDHDVKPTLKAPLPDLCGFTETLFLAPTPTPTPAVVADILSPQPIKRTRSLRRAPSSPHKAPGPQRGRPPNSLKTGPKGFKGVRQRKGVRGHLVEIRPPKWKNTIWLGTYGTASEAAAAYDAGIYYTNKKTKFNFPELQGTFPHLPSYLHLDQDQDHNEIKMFVQRQAKEAARNIKVSLAGPKPQAAAGDDDVDVELPVSAISRMGVSSGSGSSSGDGASSELETKLAFLDDDDDDWLCPWSSSSDQQVYEDHDMFNMFPQTAPWPPVGCNDILGLDL